MREAQRDSIQSGDGDWGSIKRRAERFKMKNRNEIFAGRRRQAGCFAVDLDGSGAYAINPMGAAAVRAKPAIHMPSIRSAIGAQAGAQAPPWPGFGAAGLISRSILVLGAMKK